MHHDTIEKKIYFDDTDRKWLDVEASYPDEHVFELYFYAYDDYAYHEEKAANLASSPDPKYWDDGIFLYGDLDDLKRLRDQLRAAAELVYPKIFVDLL